MVMPICADGKQDMFEPSPWNFTQFIEQCHKRWKTYPREIWIVSEYWGKSLETASNIIFRYVYFISYQVLNLRTCNYYRSCLC
jgi:lysosomal Pro-X carboxypeptidase